MTLGRMQSSCKVRKQELAWRKENGMKLIRRELRGPEEKGGGRRGGGRRGAGGGGGGGKGRGGGGGGVGGGGGGSRGRGSGQSLRFCERRHLGDERIREDTEEGELARTAFRNVPGQWEGEFTVGEDSGGGSVLRRALR